MITTALITKTILTIIQIIFIIRFHLELSKINSFLEPANTIRRITNPLVLPLKSIIPNIWAKRLAAIISVLLLSIVIVWLFNQQGIYNAFANAVLLLISTWISFLQYGMFLFVIGSWIQVESLSRAKYFLYHIFDPMLKPIKKILPDFAGLDFSPIIFLFGLSFISPYILRFVAILLASPL